MNKKTGFMNFLYRIFIEVEEPNNEELSIENPEELELAQSEEKIAKMWEKHFSSTSKTEKFKVDKTQIQEKEEQTKKVSRQKAEEREI